MGVLGQAGAASRASAIPLAAPDLSARVVAELSGFFRPDENIIFPSRLEQDIKKLKADLQASRQVEQELRSQISSLSSTERGIRSEMGQLRQENELLQNK